MAVFDVNGDGLNDVITTLEAHGFGIAWYEQKRDAKGISFVQHVIADHFSDDNVGGITFSQPHGAIAADVDGDGIMDFIVGKRHWTHHDTLMDPDHDGLAVIYAFKTRRNPAAPGGAEFVAELIDNRSGVGSQIVTQDLNSDGAPDFVASGDRGTFIFWGKKR